MRAWWVVVLALGVCVPVAASPKYGAEGVADLLEIAVAERQPEGRRAEAVRELEHTAVRTHLPILRRLLREERSTDIRLASACVLAALGDRKAPLDLLLATAYEGTRTPSVSRSDVFRALGRTGDPAAEMHLERALLSPAPPDEPYFHIEVCQGLGALNTPGSRRLLLQTLRDGAAPLRRAAITPLSTLALDRKQADAGRARTALVQAARFDPDPEVAAQAASALLWSGVDGLAFFRLLEADTDPKVRARAAMVMNRHYLSPQRLARLRAALARETHPEVRAALEATLAGQEKPR